MLSIKQHYVLSEKKVMIKKQKLHFTGGSVTLIMNSPPSIQNFMAKEFPNADSGICDPYLGPYTHIVSK